MKTQGAERFEQQVYPPKKSLLSFLFYFHFLLSIIKSVTWLVWKIWMHWFHDFEWVLHDFEENHLCLLKNWFWITLKVCCDPVKFDACGCTNVCMLRMLLLFLLRLMTMTNCMTTLGLNRVRFWVSKFLSIERYLFWCTINFPWFSLLVVFQLHVYI